MNKLKILYVEDSIDDAILVQYELRQSEIEFELLHVENKQAFIDGLENFRPDMIISDFQLYQFNALDELAILKERQLNIPFILVTGTQSEETAVECMKQGAFDYILKTSLKRLNISVNNAYDKIKSQRMHHTLDAQFKALVEHSHVGVYIVKNNKFKYVNPKFCEIFAYNSNEIYNIQFATNLFLKLNFKKFPDSFTDMLTESKDRASDPIIGIKKNGDYIFLEVLGNTTYLADDHAIIGTVLDVTDRIIAERHLRESEERLSLIYNSTSEAMALIKVIADTYIFESVNHAFQELFSKTDREVLGKSALYVFGESSYIKYFKKQLDNLKNGRLANYTENKKTENDERIFEVNLIPIFNNHKVLTHILYLSTDTTEKSKLQDQLIQSQKMEGLGTMAGGISHDFNNLLTIIIGSAEVLKIKAGKDEVVQKFISNIIEAAYRGSSIAKQMLVFARPDKSDFSTFNLSKAISEIKDMLSHFMPKLIFIDVDIPDIGIRVYGNKGQIHQAILNLSINARDAMENGGVLRIAHRILPASYINKKYLSKENCQFVEISISDTGIGMSEEILSKIFDPFFTTKEIGKGTGLGLSMVHGIVNNHKGYLDVQSKIGEGSCFYIFLPVYGSEDSEDQEFDSDIDRKKLSIMIVDDEEIIVETLKDQLEIAGHTVITAKDGLSAIDLFNEKHESIDIVLTDLGMPIMGGVDLLEQLKIVNPDVKAIAMTGYLDNLSKSELLEKGFKNVLIKPYKFQELEKTIRNV